MESGGHEIKKVVHKRGIKERGTLKVAYTNINGLMSSEGEFNLYLREDKPDIMGITETKLSEGIVLVNLGEGEYNIWRKDRRGKQGGGVMVLTKKDLVVEKVVNSEGLAEVIKVTICTATGKREVVVVYVPPKTLAWSAEEYKTMLKDTSDCLDSMAKEGNKLLLMGDFNCKEVDWEEWSTTGSEESWGGVLLRVMMENMMTQWVMENTRYSGQDEPSRLDLVFTKEVNVIENMQYLVPLGKSDHVVIKFEIREGIKTVMNENHKVGRYNYGKANYAELRRYFENADWSRFEEAKGVEEKWNLFLGIYNEGVVKYVPTVKESYKGKNDWFNMRCRDARKRKEEAWRRWNRTKRVNQWKVYKQERNEYIRICREERSNFERDIVTKSKDQPKLLYRYINGRLKQQEGVQRLNVNGEVHADEVVMAEIMNEYFQGVFTRESDFEEPNGPRLTGPYLNNIAFTVKDVTSEMEKLDVRKSQGPDGVSNWVLKECNEQLATRVYTVIESSLTEGVVPLDWKAADIVPIHKSGKKDDPQNYRPVSLTSVVAKICEKIIKQVWTRHLEEYEVITERQFGFRAGRSCLTNLLCFYSRVIDVVQERDGWADAIYLDLRKAFDKVPHQRLLWKLKTFGRLGDGPLKWMEDFLTNRLMRTSIRNGKSSWRRVTSGVPQGSVLAPIMFAIYINDMIEGVNSYMTLFADDAKIMRRVKNEGDCNMLQKDLDTVWKWSVKWEMEFNIKKCSVMEFGKSGTRVRGNYKLGNTNLDKKNEERDLGVIITDNLSPEKHVNRITAETYNLLRNIRAAFSYFDEDMVRELIVSLIRPRLEYAAVAWSPSLKKHIRKIEQLHHSP